MRAVHSLLANTRRPDELLIIDDDEIPLETFAALAEACDAAGVTLRYHKKRDTQLRRGLSESKNWAAELAAHDILCFLDDDVVVDNAYFAELMRVWEAAVGEPMLAGVGGRIKNNRPTTSLERSYRHLFGLAGSCAWDVNDVGFQVWDESVQQTERAYYLHGGVSSYRRTFLLAHPFATFAGGRTSLEDVEQCMRAKRGGYHFYYAPAAFLMHHHEAEGRERAFHTGLKEGANRKAIFRMHCSQDAYHHLWFYWANTGWIFKKILTFRFREAGGMAMGVVRRRTVQVTD